MVNQYRTAMYQNRLVRILTSSSLTQMHKEKRGGGGVHKIAKVKGKLNKGKWYWSRNSICKNRLIRNSGSCISFKLTSMLSNFDN